MTNDLLSSFSNQLAEAVSGASPAVVQVQGRRRPASGLVYADNVVLTTVRALGREDGLHVRRDDGQTFEAELAGWDPATSLAVLRVTGLGTAAIAPATATPRVGHLALAVARSWSNAVTASGDRVGDRRSPRTGRRHAIDQVIRTSAPMHDGFAGGAFVDTAGALLGVATAGKIRGLGVVVPVSIAWKQRQRFSAGRRAGTSGSPDNPSAFENQRAANGRSRLARRECHRRQSRREAGVLVGDVRLDGQAIEYQRIFSICSPAIAWAVR
jgi:S1-C subfamily serine protease